MPDAGASSVPFHFQISVAHGDSPTFKIKSVDELEGPSSYVRLNTEAYGGMIDYTWFDRPLGIAGRVLVREGTQVVSHLVAPHQDCALIPSVPIHMNRGVNAGFAPNRAVDICPVISTGDLHVGSLDEFVARELDINHEQIVARDLFLVNHQAPSLWGLAHEFISSPKLNDLACVYAALQAFIQSKNDTCVNVMCCFDNEEVGSMTKQGAQSTLLADTLSRIVAACEGTREDYLRALSASMLVSCDNAHALHPNHPELHDGAAAPMLNQGIVIKEAANQHYCTDAFSHAVFLALCQDAHVSTQVFANRSDMPGGSTLGSLSNTQASMHAVDVGLTQLAMHSSYETAGSRDVATAIDALSAFFRAPLIIESSRARW